MTADVTLAVVGFAVGGHRFAIPAATVAAMRPFTEDPDGGVAIESILGLGPADGGSGRRILHLRRPGGGLAAVAVPGAVTLEPLPAAAIHPLPPLVAARIRIAGARALAIVGDKAVLILDPGHFPGLV